MQRQLLPALRMLLVLTVVSGLAFPLVVTGIAQVAFRHQAEGSLVHFEGHVVGSALLGQEFTEPQYFHGRPSAAGAGASGSMVPVLGPDGQEIVGADGAPESAPVRPHDLDAAVSGASNLGPTNPVLLATVVERARAYRAENNLAADVSVPVDAVTASGSGVDPQISVANARLQAPRVASATGLPIPLVLAMIDKHTDGRSLGFMGEPGVNVLELNLALANADR